MKKSNALMLSYMIFLVLSILAQIIFHWEGLDRIAIAATIAGCFFAFSDLSNWCVSYNLPIIEAMQKDVENIKDIGKTAVSLIESQTKEVNEVIELVEPHVGVIPQIDTILEKSRLLLQINEDRENEVQDANQRCEEIQKELDKEKRKLHIIKKMEILFATIGFIFFFSLVSFNRVLDFFYPYQEITTVLTFVIIMLTYFLRDIFEEKAKQQIDEISMHIDDGNKKISELSDKAKQTLLLDKIKILVERLNQLENVQKENTDEQTENAQHEQG